MIYNVIYTKSTSYRRPKSPFRITIHTLSHEQPAAILSLPDLNLPRMRMCTIKVNLNGAMTVVVATAAIRELQRDHQSRYPVDARRFSR